MAGFQRMLSRRSATADQLRAAIDRGETGDKVPVFDPAVAPLDTDAEAAGTPVSEQAAEVAIREEVHAAPRPDGGSRIRPLVWSALAALVYLAALSILMWAMLA
jgi:hypothetical protein